LQAEEEANNVDKAGGAKAGAASEDDAGNAIVDGGKAGQTAAAAGAKPCIALTARAGGAAS
jgi:hypothetical protein